MEQSQWFYMQDNQQIGPVGYGEIVDLLSRGQLTAGSYVWTEGMTDWQQIGQIPELVAYAGAGQPTQRPTSVTVLGILNIVFGGLGLMCTPFSIISIWMPQPDSPFQLTDAMKMFTTVGAFVGIFFAIVLLASGIGLLKLKNWARQAAYIYGWAAVIWGVLSLITNGIMLSSNLGGMSEEMMPAAIGGLVGGMCGGLFGLIYPVILIIFMRKPHIITACKQ